MLNMTVRNTAKLIRSKSKSENVRLGRFFTKKETARLMANMLTLDESKTAYTVLDPGAGTGILTAAVIEEICTRCKSCRQIFVTCYENNPEFVDMLQDNLERVRKKARHDYDVRVYVTIYEENYITESQNHYTVTFVDIVHGILQARILEWVVFPFSRGSSHPGIEPRSPILQADSLPAEPSGNEGHI